MIIRLTLPDTPNYTTPRGTILGIYCVVLAALYIRFHVGWRHQLHVMTQCGEFAGPVMGSGTSFHADDTW